MVPMALNKVPTEVLIESCNRKCRQSQNQLPYRSHLPLEWNFADSPGTRVAVAPPHSAVRTSSARASSPKRGQRTWKLRSLTYLNPNRTSLYNIHPRFIVPNNMEPITAAGAFSTIVSLLRIFKQERGDQKKADHQTFMEWLEYHQHKELKNLIVNTAALRTEVIRSWPPIMRRCSKSWTPSRKSLPRS